MTRCFIDSKAFAVTSATCACVALTAFVRAFAATSHQRNVECFNATEYDTFAVIALYAAGSARISVRGPANTKVLRMFSPGFGLAIASSSAGSHDRELA